MSDFGFGFNQRRLATLQEIQAYEPSFNEANDIEKVLQMMRESDPEKPYTPKHGFDDMFGPMKFGYLLCREQFWKQLVEAREDLRFFLPPTLGITFGTSAPESVSSGSAVAVGSLFSLDPGIYRFLDEKIQRSEQVVKEYLEAFPLGVLQMDRKVQLAYPALVGQALAKLPLCEETIRSECLNHLDEGLFLNKSFVVNWVRNGGAVENLLIPDEILSDAAVKAAFADSLETKRPLFNTTPLPLIPDEWLKDKITVLQLVRGIPDYLLLIQEGDPTFGDWDVTIAAISTTCGLSLYFTLPNEWQLANAPFGYVEYWKQLSATVKKKLAKGENDKILQGARDNLKLMGIHWA